MHALSVAVHLGFDPIWVSGIDSDFFRTLGRTANGGIGLGAHHVYSSSETLTTEAAQFDGDAAAFLEDAGRVIGDFRLFRGRRICNTHSRSLVDAFPFDPDCPLL